MTASDVCVVDQTTDTVHQFSALELPGEGILKMVSFASAPLTSQSSILKYTSDKSMLHTEI